MKLSTLLEIEDPFDSHDEDQEHMNRVAQAAIATWHSLNDKFSALVSKGSSDNFEGVLRKMDTCTNKVLAMPYKRFSREVKLSINFFLRERQAILSRAATSTFNSHSKTLSNRKGYIYGGLTAASMKQKDKDSLVMVFNAPGHVYWTKKKDLDQPGCKELLLYKSQYDEIEQYLQRK